MPPLDFIRSHADIFARCGSVVASYRTTNGRRCGPYYRLAYREGGRQRSLYLGASEELVAQVRSLLTELQARRDYYRMVAQSERLRRENLLRIKRQWQQAALAHGLYARGWELRGWRPPSLPSLSLPRVRLTLPLPSVPYRFYTNILRPIIAAPIVAGAPPVAVPPSGTASPIPDTPPSPETQTASQAGQPSTTETRSTSEAGTPVPPAPPPEALAPRTPQPILAEGHHHRSLGHPPQELETGLISLAEGHIHPPATITEPHHSPPPAPKGHPHITPDHRDGAPFQATFTLIGPGNKCHSPSPIPQPPPRQARIWQNRPSVDQSPIAHQNTRDHPPSGSPYRLTGPIRSPPFPPKKAKPGK